MSVPLHATRRRFFIPEVVQTSGMDCGPAALAALLAGFNAPVSYGRLREACHTDVDGTSIDTLEDIGRQLGLDAEQIMLPRDHVLLDEAHALPAIAVVRTPTGAAHFAVIWRVVGPYVQIMDPARGRMWLHREALFDRLFQHTMPVSAAGWRTWAASDEFTRPLKRRLSAVGVNRSQSNAFVNAALGDPSWRGIAALDAAVRLLHSLVAGGAVRRSHAPSTLKTLTSALCEPAEQGIVPDQYWSAIPAASPSGEEQIVIRGAVIVRARGLLRDPDRARKETRSPELTAALKEQTPHPLRHVIAAVRADGLTPMIVGGAAIAIAAVGVAVEAMLLRSVLDVSTLLNLPEQLLTAGAIITLFAASMLGLELVLALLERRAGNHLEGRLRVAFLEKLPRLSDAYFQSRPMSDMLERSHNAHVVRTLPQLAVRCARVAAELLVTTLAIAWLSPPMALVAVAAAALAAGIPLVGNTLAIDERDLRVRTHAGALARFHLDALLGRTAIEAHGAEAAIEREHDRLLAEWAGASHALQRASVFVEGVQMLVGFAIAGWILLGHFTGESTAATLLLTYWILNVPTLGYELALAAREYPAQRSTILRILEPLSAPEIAEREQPPAPVPADQTAVEIEARRMTVRVSGHQILEEIDLHIAPGRHVAILGASGAGKSTLVGALLGWYRPAEGELLVDGEPLTPDRIDAIRRDTAWVDPTVQIWNRSLLDNLLYGSDDSTPLAPVLEAASLMPVVAKLSDGLATPLGEGGKLLSAGEGQRVRLGRAMVKQSARLVILDEPFLGLERDRRRVLLAQTRQRWAGKTLLYVTHDVSEARAFDRVLILDRGRIVEDGDPMQLSQTPSSRFRRLLQTQEAVTARLTTGAEWRRIRLDSGRIVQEHGNSFEQRA